MCKRLALKPTPWSSALTWPSSGLPQQPRHPQIQCVTGLCFSLLYPSRTQEGPIPSLSWLSGSWTTVIASITTAGATSFTIHLPTLSRSLSLSLAHVPSPPVASLSTSTPSPPASSEIGISFSVLHAYRQYCILPSDITSVPTCKRSLRPLPGTTIITTNTKPVHHGDVLAPRRHAPAAHPRPLGIPP